MPSSNADSSSGVTKSSQNARPGGPCGAALSNRLLCVANLVAPAESVHERAAIVLADVSVEEPALGERAPHGDVGFFRNLVISVAPARNEHHVELMLDWIVVKGTDDRGRHERMTRAPAREFPP